MIKKLDTINKANKHNITYEETANHAICPESLKLLLEHFLGNVDISDLKTQLNNTDAVPLVHKEKLAGYITKTNKDTK